MAARWAGRSTRNWRENVRPTVLGRSTVCHWCGHPGANAVDHHPIPLDELLRTAPQYAEDPDYCQPIHGVEGCSICPPRKGKPRRCNQEKSNKINAVPPTPGSRPW